MKRRRNGLDSLVLIVFPPLAFANHYLGFGWFGEYSKFAMALSIGIGVFFVFVSKRGRRQLEVMHRLDRIRRYRKNAGAP